MSIGFGQLIIILIIAIILFGKFPNLIRDLSNGIKALSTHLEEKSPPKIDSKSNKNDYK